MDNKREIKMHDVLTNIPEEFVVEMKAKDGKKTYYPTFGGLMFLATNMGKPILRTKVTENTLTSRVEQTTIEGGGVLKDTVWSGEMVAECEAYLIPNAETLKANGIEKDSPLWDMWKIPVISHGTVNPDNTKPAMMAHARGMAETRANVRALRILTGCSYTAFEEMKEAEICEQTFESRPKIVTLNEMMSPPEKKVSQKADMKAIFATEAKDRKGMTTALYSGLDDKVIRGLMTLEAKKIGKSELALNEMTDEQIANIYRVCRERALK